MSRKHESYNIQPKITAMAVRSACQQIGHEYNMKKALEDIEAEKTTPTGRVPTTEPQVQEFPK